MDIGCSCSCSMDGERPVVFEEHWPKARKEHVCVECGETIKLGQRYEYASGLWDGFWDHHKTCKTCVNIRNDVCCGSFIYGELREAIWETYGVDYVTGDIWEEEKV